MALTKSQLKQKRLFWKIHLAKGRTKVFPYHLCVVQRCLSYISRYEKCTWNKSYKNCGMSCSKKTPTYRCLCDALSGYYVYTEVSNRTGFYADAHLISPFFRQAGKTCKFKFWYHMWGPNIGYLQIYYRRNSRDKRLLSIFGNKGNKWIQGQVDVPKCASDFQVGKFFFLIGC